MDNNVFRGLSYGVYLITAPDGERPTGCVANSLIQVTTSPATVALSLNHDNYTNGCVAKGGKFGVTILAEDSDPSLIGRFGFASGRDTDKFQGLDYALTQGVPLPKVKGCGWLVCQVVDKLETDTHTVFLAKVLDGEPAPGTPMTYAYYHQVIKGPPTPSPPRPTPRPAGSAASAAISTTGTPPLRSWARITAARSAVSPSRCSKRSERLIKAGMPGAYYS